MSPTTGKHNCLWCKVSSDDLKNPPPSVPSRTVDDIISDHTDFVADGANLKKAKEFFNCVREPFFKEIPLDQVNS